MFFYLLVLILVSGLFWRVGGGNIKNENAWALTYLSRSPHAQSFCLIVLLPWWTQTHTRVHNKQIRLIMLPRLLMWGILVQVSRGGGGVKIFAGKSFCHDGIWQHPITLRRHVTLWHHCMTSCDVMTSLYDVMWHHDVTLWCHMWHHDVTLWCHMT